MDEISSNASSIALTFDNSSPHYDFIGRTYQSSIEEEKKRREIYDSILTKDVPKTSALPNIYADFKPTNEREYGIKELLDTEINYCNALKMIVEKFHNQLKHRLFPDDFDTIFMNLTVNLKGSHFSLAQNVVYFRIFGKHTWIFWHNSLQLH